MFEKFQCGICNRHEYLTWLQFPKASTSLSYFLHALIGLSHHGWHFSDCTFHSLLQLLSTQSIQWALSRYQRVCISYSQDIKGSTEEYFDERCFKLNQYLSYKPHLIFELTRNLSKIFFFVFQMIMLTQIKKIDVGTGTLRQRKEVFSG